jgi:hypothetical protein
MLELIESLSLVSGTFVIATLSAALAFIWARLANTVVRWTATLGAPLLLSYALYWSPVWLGASRSEYSAWTFAFILPWFVIGGLVSGAIVFFVGRRIRAKTHADA